jgi:hypothetical protein
MDRSYVTENTKSRERLRRMVSNISDSELELVIYKEGWAIAAAMAYLVWLDRLTMSGLRIIPHVLAVALNKKPVVYYPQCFEYLYVS